MTAPLAFSAPEKRLLPEGRAGPMPWVIAIMSFLTVLATAAGLALANAAQAIGDQVAGRVTIQIVTADATARAAQAEAVIKALARVPGIERVAPVPQAEVARALEPWLGAGSEALSLPALIDAELSGPTALARLQAEVRRVAPDARVDAHARWLAPLRDLIATLRWLAGALVLLMAAATAACVVLAARAALDTHRETIGLMHLLGSTDAQVARLFQRRIALDALFGGGIGLGAGVLVLLMLEQRIGALGSELAGTVRLGVASWLALVAVPLLGALLATAAARLTVERALKATL